jgi:hypothetical protein
MPAAGLKLSIHGGNANVDITVDPKTVAPNGVTSVITLPSQIDPLPISILQALENLLPKDLTDPGTATSPAPANLPSVKIGEEGCQQEFTANASTDTFPYNVFIRLVEPQLSIVNEIQWVRLGEASEFFLPLPVYQTGVTPYRGAFTSTSYADRVPVEQPLSVDGFRDQIMGLESNGLFGADETVPMAATLGLGYVLEMQQRWTFAGVGLGDLVYSLPLAPGEQIEMAVFERTDTSVVTESETFSESEAQQQSALADTSTQATFNSAFSEASRGGSAFATESSSGGFSIPLFGGGGASQSSGVATSWMQGQRDMTQAAAQTTHSAASNQASARRTAARTGMRLASATENESVTTKTITNHNHAHALTMQYWEVIRNYNVTTVIDGLTLCCLVPMQIVRFMPPGQPFTLTGVENLSRQGLLARYTSLIKHLDVLQKAVPRRYQYGLTLLEQFSADPTATVDSAGGVAEDVIDFKLVGSFLPCETISIRGVTRRGTRVGPVRLTLGKMTPIPADTFASKDELLAWLGDFRRSTGTVAGTGKLALPLSMNRADIVGFEITRNFDAFSYTLISQEMAAIRDLGELFTGKPDWQSPAASSLPLLGSTARATITVSARDLESALGGPLVDTFTANIVEFDGNGNEIVTPSQETYANESLGNVELPPQPYPVPALQIGPVLHYKDVLEIEKVMHHVVRNTTEYSKALWSSLTADERAILLDAYTIGVPSGGIADPSQMVPLLNCVENRLLGFFGNSMILPFRIPQAPNADGRGAGDGILGLDQGEIERALLAYQQAGFVPPSAVISLPTKGVLGKAVLGCCPSAEKIDLTRFWNWQDSPSDQAPTINPVSLPTTTPSLTTGLTAPNSLGQLPSLINNVLTPPAPNTSLLQSLGQNFASQKDFDTALTAAAQLASILQGDQKNASDARKDAIASNQALTQQAMQMLGGIVTGDTSGKGANGGKNGKSASSSSSSSSTGSDVASAVSTLAPILLALL